jgi:hypothetical protein
MWLTCAGSLIPNILADDITIYEAAEGTVAHMVGDIWLRDGEEAAYALLGSVFVQEGFEIEIDEDMLAYIRDYVKFCHNVGEKYEHHFEQRVDLSRHMPIDKQGGTADHAACAPGHLVIDDLKFGTGIRVFAASDLADPRSMIDGEPNGNTQAMCYALGFFDEWDWFYSFQRITIRICQPRLNHFEVWETTREELLKFAEYLKIRAAAAWVKDAPRTPSPKGCLWCRVQDDCPAKIAWLEEAVDNCFTDLDATEGSYDKTAMVSISETVSDSLSVDVIKLKADPATLPLSALAKILPYRKSVEKWFAAIEERLVREIVENEADIPGWKMVQGRSNRIFPDEAKADRALRRKGLKKSDMYVTKMLSPAQMEEALHRVMKVSKSEAKEIVDAMSEKPLGSRTLVQANDKRLALPAAGDVFVDLDAEDTILDDL